MQLKTKVRAGGVDPNHNQPFVIGIGQSELESLATVLQVRTGLNAGAPKPFLPCV